MPHSNTDSNKPYERVEQPLSQILTRNFLGGLVWGAGSVLGAALIVVVIGFLISTSKEIPLLGDVVQVVVSQVEEQLEESPYYSP